MTAQQPITLYELNSYVREVLALDLPESYWVKAELSEVRLSGKGHCYLGLVEKEETGYGLRAQAGAVIWRNNYAALAERFERETGSPLTAGIKVLVQVKVLFHEVYGLRYNILNIDASYTLGDIQRRRREILKRLTDEGVVDMNRELPLPRPCLRIAIISSAGAAGYGDFMRQLEAAPYAFRTRLFPALMQGADAEQSLLAALEEVMRESEKWDVVALLRGGGAVSDLNCFDTYLLAAAVAQFPLPVFTGIGHDRDETVLDLVANQRFKTPTAVAAFLVDGAHAEMELVEDYTMRLQNAAHRTLDHASLTLAHLDRQIRQAANRSLEYAKFTISHLSRQIRRTAPEQCRRQALALDDKAERIHRQARHLVNSQWQLLQFLSKRIPAATRRALNQESERHRHIEEKLALASPVRSLRMGFSLTMVGGQVVRSAAQLRPGDKIVTILHDGQAKSTVTATEHHTGKASGNRPSHT